MPNGRQNAIGAWFEKLADGWIFGSQLYQFTFRNTAELIGSTNPTKYEHTFQEKDGILAHIEDIPTVPLPDGRIQGGIVSWRGTGYTFDVSASVSRMGGQEYAVDATEITLDPADPTNDREAGFFITPTIHIAKESAASPNPVIPQADPPFEIFLTSVRVTANTLTPVTGQIIYIYRENTEWTGSTNAPGNVNFDSTAFPYNQTKAIETTNITNGFFISMDYGNTLLTSDFDNLSVRLRLKAEFTSGYTIGFRLRNGSNQLVGSFSNIYLNPTLINEYQFLAVGFDSFKYSGQFRYVDIIFTRTKGSTVFAGFYLDDWKLDGTVTNVQPIGAHNTLEGLQGGDGTNYYHLGQDEYDAATNANSPSSSNPYVTASDLIGVGMPPVDADYVNQAAMIAAQGDQTAHYLYYDGTSYWEYMGTTNGNITDYREVGGGSSGGGGCEIVEEPFLYTTGSPSFNLTLAPPKVWVFLNGVYIPEANYTLSGINVTITSTIPANSRVVIKYCVGTTMNTVYPPVGGTYVDEATMIAAQGTQVPQYIYFDGSYYWEYLGTTNGNITDYRKITLPDVPHNDLSGLQGGQASQYYHLNLTDYTELRKIVNLNPTGTVWVSRTTPNTSSDWKNIAYGNGIYLTGSISGSDKMMISYDSVTWQVNTNAPGALFGSVNVTFGNGVFVVCGSNASNNIFVSSDGVTWQSAVTVPAGTWRNVFFMNGYFFASNTSVLSSGLIKSVDGLTWTDVTIPVQATWTSGAYGNGVYVIVSQGGPTLSNRVIYSTDTITWSISPTTNTSSWVQLVYGNSLFVSMNTIGHFGYSSDGITWTYISGASGIASDPNWGGLAYGRGAFVATGGTTQNNVQVSTDGINWVSYPSTTNNTWLSLVYNADDGIFVALSRTNDLANVMTNSPDKLINHSNVNLNDGRNPHKTRYEDLLGTPVTPQSTFDYIDTNISSVETQITTVDDRVTDVETQLSTDIQNLADSINYRTVGISISGAGNPITTGIKGYVSIPYNAEILGWYIVSDVPGSIVIDVWKSTTIPTGANTIAGTERPTLSAAQENQDEALTTWSINLSTGDVMAFNVVSASSVTFVNLVLKIKIV